MSDVTSHQVGDGAQNGFSTKDMQEEFGSSYMQPTAQQPNYGFPPNDQQYIQNYYGQMAFGPYVGEWSTGGESVPYLSAYNSVGNGEPHRNFMQDAMFNQQTNTLGNGQAYFNAPVFQQGNDFTAWTSSPGHNSGLDVIGHQSGSTYNGDFYHQILPPMPQDYLERNDGMNNPATPGGIPAGNQAPQGNYVPVGLSSGDGVKLTGATNSMPMLERGMQGLNVANAVNSDPEPVSAKGSQMNPNSMVTRVDNTPHRVDYGPGTAQMNIAQASNAQTTPPAHKPISWAAIASKPAKPQAKPKPKPAVGLPPPVKHTADGGNWETGVATVRTTNSTQPGSRAYGWSGSRTSHQSYEKRGEVDNEDSKSDKDESGANSAPASSHPVLDKLKLQNEYNPKRLTIDLRNSRFFVIKSYSEDDIHRSIKYNIWCSTEHGNKRLDATFRAQKNRGPVILLYSVNGSGHFCGVAEMKTCVDYSSRAGVWSQDKWKGKFQVKWIYVKDVPNTVLRHIRLENNDNKPVTNSRDTQEVPAEKGRQVLKIIANYKHQTSIFDDFGHYERRQLEEETQKNRAAQSAMNRERKSGENQQTYSVKTAST